MTNDPGQDERIRLVESVHQACIEAAKEGFETAGQMGQAATGAIEMPDLTAMSTRPAER